MASSTINLSKSASSGGYIESKIVWSATADPNTNTSKNVTAKIYVRKDNTDMILTIPTSGTWSYSITINGNKVSGSISKEVLLDWVLLGTHTVGSIDHNSDGTKSISIAGSVSAPSGTGFAGHTSSGSGTAKFDTIPRASSIDSLVCATKYFTGQMTYKYTPQSSSFYNRCNVALNINGTHTAVKTINLGQKAASQQTATVTLTAAELTTIYNALPNTDKGKLRFTFRTYSDSGYSTQVGDPSVREIDLYIPNDSTTQPTATVAVTPVSSLASPFNTLYIAGRTKVDVNFTNGAGKYKATVTGYEMSVGGVTYGSPYTSGYLTEPGEVSVISRVTDSRGFTRVYTTKITVIAYAPPKIQDVVAERCDKNGNPSESGTYLKITATRSYHKVVSGGVQKNFCQIRYRYKLNNAASYSSWTTILAGSSTGSDTIVTGALLGGALSAQNTYLVQVQAIDDIGEHGYTTITVPTEVVYWHRDGARGSLTFGGYVEEDDTFAIAPGKTFKVKSTTGEDVVVSDTGWISLGLADTVNPSTSNFGRVGTGCYYRVINGNHVFVAFNCAFQYSGSAVTVGGSMIPAPYKPPRNQYTLCVTNGRGVARIFVNSTGDVRIDYVQNMASAETTSSITVNWIDGYIDYFV
jgi:hypothetical protein